MDNLNKISSKEPPINLLPQEKIETSSHSQLVNQFVIDALSEESPVKPTETFVEQLKSIKTKGLQQSDFKRIAETLSAESMAPGSRVEPIQYLIYSLLGRSHSNTELYKLYENYYKLTDEAIVSGTDMKLFSLPPECGTYKAFLSTDIPEHHINNIVSYDGDKYSLTTINSGDGIEYHHKNPLGKYYTRQTLTNISREKIAEFINNAPYDSSKALYQAIDKLEGRFDPQQSFVDNEQLGGSCAGRQELLMLKHVMSKEEYNRLKIELHEYSIIFLSGLYKSGVMSTRDKIIYLDAVQRLEKKYQKSGQVEMMQVMMNAEERIKKDISTSPQKPKSWLFGTIPDLPKNVHPLLRSFVKGLKSFQQGDLVNAKKELEAFYFIIDHVKDLYDNPNNLEALRIIEIGFDNLEKVMAFESFSLEQHNLLAGMICNFDKLQKKAVFFGLKDKFSTPVIERPSAYELKFNFNKHDFVKNSPWAEDWKKLVTEIKDDPPLLYLLGLLLPSPSRAFKSIKNLLSN